MLQKSARSSISSWRLPSSRSAWRAAAARRTTNERRPRHHRRRRRAAARHRRKARATAAARCSCWRSPARPRTGPTNFRMNGVAGRAGQGAARRFAPHGCTDVLLPGKVQRPKFSEIKLDAKGFMVAAARDRGRAQGRRRAAAFLVDHVRARRLSRRRRGGSRAGPDRNGRASGPHRARMPRTRPTSRRPSRSCARWARWMSARRRWCATAWPGGRGRGRHRRHDRAHRTLARTFARHAGQAARRAGQGAEADPGRQDRPAGDRRRRRSGMLQPRSWPASRWKPAARLIVDAQAVAAKPTGWACSSSASRPDDAALPAKPLTLMLVCGEPSGDQLGAQLMAGLKAIAGDNVTIRRRRRRGDGAQGLKSLFPLDATAVMGLREVVPTIPAILRARPRGVRFRACDPAGCGGADRQSRFHPPHRARLKQRDPSIRTINYVAPQVWATRAYRARKMAQIFRPGAGAASVRGAVLREIRLALGLRRPSGDRAGGEDHGWRGACARGSASLPDAPLLALLPGSRTSEIRFILPVFREAVRRSRAANSRPGHGPADRAACRRHGARRDRTTGRHRCTSSRARPTSSRRSMPPMWRWPHRHGDDGIGACAHADGRRLQGRLADLCAREAR